MYYVIIKFENTKMWNCLSETYLSSYLFYNSSLSGNKRKIVYKIPSLYEKNKLSYIKECNNEKKFE